MSRCLLLQTLSYDTLSTIASYLELCDLVALSETCVQLRHIACNTHTHQQKAAKEKLANGEWGLADAPRTDVPLVTFKDNVVAWQHVPFVYGNLLKKRPPAFATRVPEHSLFGHPKHHRCRQCVASRKPNNVVFGWGGLRPAPNQTHTLLLNRAIPEHMPAMLHTLILRCVGTDLPAVPIPTLRVLQASRCDFKNVKLVMPNLLRLRLINCSSFVHIAQPLKMLKHAVITDCSSVTNVKWLAKCGNVSIRDCVNVTNVSSLTHATVLNISGCVKIDTLATLTRVRVLNCSGTRIVSTSGLNQARTVKATNCHRLSDLSGMPNVVHLFINGATMLQSLASLDSPHLQVVNVSRCVRLADLSPVKHVLSVNADFTSNITNIAMLGGKVTELRANSSNVATLPTGLLGASLNNTTLRSVEPLRSVVKLSLHEAAWPGMRCNNFTNAVHVTISGTTIRSVAGLEKARYLDVSRCHMLTHLNELLGTTGTVIAKRCNSLRCVAGLQHKHLVNLDGTLVKDVSPLRNVHTVSLFKCTHITDVGMLGNAYALDVRGCINLKDACLPLVASVTKLTASIRHRQLANCAMLTCREFSATHSNNQLHVMVRAYNSGNRPGVFKGSVKAGRALALLDFTIQPSEERTMRTILHTTEPPPNVLLLNPSQTPIASAACLFL